MREIKFRGQSLDANEWFFGGYYNILELRKDILRHIIIATNDGPGAQSTHEAININTLGQFTGLKDKNGKEIYEGDIVASHNGEVQGVVLYQAPEFIIKRKLKHKTWTQFILGAAENQYQEIIGNIYEKPELLEVKNGG